MTERTRLPKRSDSADDFVRQTRIGAALALLIVAAAVASDLLDETFWAAHPMITSLLASLLVIVISAAVINELLERRDRQRWMVVAQYVLLDLVRTARVTWTGLLEIAGLLESDRSPMTSLTDARSVVADRAGLRAGVAAMVADPHRRETLHRAVAAMSRHCDDVLGRWASVLLGATAYTEVLDRHVELYSRIAWVDGLLGHYEPMDDDPRRRLNIASPAAELQQDFDDDALCDMIVSIVGLAESLDRATLTIAMHLVPLDWWQARTEAGTAAPSHA